jgi:hypothetical protein
MTTAWQGMRSGQLPPLVAGEMNAAFHRLGRAVAARRAAAAGSAATDVRQAALDLELQYQPPAEVDRERFALWASRMLIHAAAHDRDAVSGDVATLEWIRARFSGAIGRPLDAGLREARAAADAGNLPAAADRAARLATEVRLQGSRS